MKKCVIICLILTCVIFGYLYYENTTLVVTNYEIKSSKVPKSFDGYKIAQISDFHNSSFDGLNNDLIESIYRENPDIVVVTGDAVDSYFTNIDIFTSFISKIDKPIYYVSGNHEKRLDNYDDFISNLSNVGVNVLENESNIIFKGEDRLEIIGISDTDEEESITEELSVIEENNFYKILLAHRPEFFDSYVETGVDLVLSGHTHGGGVILPYFGGLVASNQGIFPKYSYGLYEEDDTSMIISRGIGGTVPFRINNKPELVIVTLRSVEI